ncbi:UV radiation resistance-associated protein isoform X2 [Coccinella septempunctata]|uniref:UV radiation resistance-associated protein isoform X2 n=1 Tax=Coccinella septempunctata TaxID=41139 RepID=UPI001D0994BE|nr:UV radiation resistance-associated protein isoform X2 [Coccinella septempunctata]
MNFSSNEIILEAQRGRQWSPLITQQLRLRHINQVWCLNLKCERNKLLKFYFTLHLTTMSAPFYTSDKTCGPHPKWQDLILNNYPTTTAVVLRIWQHEENNSDCDKMILVWGLHLSGMVYLGNKIVDVQPSLFNHNTVIFCMFGGFFTSVNCIRNDIHQLPDSLSQHLNVIDFPTNRIVYKRITTLYNPNNVKRSYNVDKLKKLHYKEVTIKNKTIDVQQLKEKITKLDVSLQKHDQQVPLMKTKSTSQLLTMDHLNRMLDEKPTPFQKQEMFRMKVEIESAKSKTKLAGQCLEQKWATIKQLRKSYSELMESNTEKESELMEKFRILSKEKEKLKEYHKLVKQHQELLIHKKSQLSQRKRQLLQQLLWIYPIEEVSDKKYTINGMHLPNSDLLSDITDDGVSVALGYVTHILMMCSKFLQVPLRYPMTHVGSRSTVIDETSPDLPEKEFPLYTKGKDRMQFTYGVFLLNKNIAQLRWLYNMHTQDLKLTLPNLLNFLQGYKESKQERFMVSLPDITNNSENINSQNILSAVQKLPPLCSFNEWSSINDKKIECPISPEARRVKCRSDNGDMKSSHLYKGPSHPPTEESTRNISNNQLNCDISSNKDSNNKKVDCLQHSESVEEGTDLLNPKSSLSDLVVDTNGAGSGNLEPKLLHCDRTGVFISNSKNDSSGKANLICKDQEEFLQNWLRTGPALVCSDKNLYPDEYLGSTSSVQSAESPLTARTDALVSNKSFNLVKPKY